MGLGSGMEGSGGVRPVMRRDVAAAVAAGAVLVSAVYSTFTGRRQATQIRTTTSEATTSTMSGAVAEERKDDGLNAGGLGCEEVLRLARDRRCRQLIGRVATASRRESEQRVFALLSQCRDGMGRTAVHVAASNGDAELIAHLVEMGGKQQQNKKRDAQRASATSTSTSSSNAGLGMKDGEEQEHLVEKEGEEELVEEEADELTARRRQKLVDARDRHGLTPLEYAAWRGNTAAIDMLLQYGYVRLFIISTLRLLLFLFLLLLLLLLLLLMCVIFCSVCECVCVCVRESSACLR